MVSMYQGKVIECLEAEIEARSVATMDKGERLCDLVEFPEIVEGFPTDKAAPDQIEALIDHIIEHASRDTAIALISRAIPKRLREAVSSKLRKPASDVKLTDGGCEFQVLESQSTMFAAYFNGSLGDKPSVELSKEFCSRRSMRQILPVMYGGKYRLPRKSREVVKDVHTANYLDVLHLLQRDLSGDETARVNNLVSLDWARNNFEGLLIEMKASPSLRMSQRLKDRESGPRKAR